MEAVYCSETSVSIYQITRWNIPETAIFVPTNCVKDRVCQNYFWMTLEQKTLSQDTKHENKKEAKI
jgi:hypothetical protein